MIHLPYPRACPCGVVHKQSCGGCASKSVQARRSYRGMFLTDDAKNRMLDAMDESQSTGMVYASVHTAFSQTGANEVSGGAPAYTRRPVTWSLSANGVKSMIAPFPTFNIPGNTEAAWLGFSDNQTPGLGTFKGMTPMGAGQVLPCSVEPGGSDFSSNIVQSASHNLSSGQQVVFWGNNLPSPLQIGTFYYVSPTNLGTDTFSIAASASALTTLVDITGTHPVAFSVQPCQSRHFDSQGTITPNTGTITITGPPPPVSTFTCTEIVGFSVTESWYGIAPFQPSPITGFIQTIPDPQNWQLRWASGGSIDQWGAGNFFSGWFDNNNLVTRCAQNSNNPDRMIINISGQYSNDPGYWANYIQQTIGFMWRDYSPGVQRILMQAAIGGPGGGTCPTSDPQSQFGTVRCTYNYPAIRLGIQQAISWINTPNAVANYGTYSGSAAEGSFATADACGNFSDWAGHITSPFQATVGQRIANYYIANP
jgi:hypothetical protein